MLFTLFAAALAALILALSIALVSGDSARFPHDPSTLELAAMAAFTLAVYAWMRRLRAVRERAGAAARQLAPPSPVPERYAEAKASADHEAVLEGAEHAA